MAAHLVVSLSPSGSTRTVAEGLAFSLTRMGEDAECFDLTDFLKGHEPFPAVEPGGCLWIGSPVYVLHALPPVMEVIRRLPRGEGRYAVPFVTYGGVTGGTALEEMGRALTARGFALAGAAKVMARHSSLWRFDVPLGSGRPDHDDFHLLEELAETVVERIHSGAAGGPAPEALGPANPAVREAAASASLDKVRDSGPSLLPNPHSCTLCGYCVASCPTGARSLDPMPAVAAESCIYCKTCVKSCPFQAISFDTTGFLERLTAMSEAFGEGAKTLIYT